MMYAAAGQCFCYIIITICIRYNENDALSVTTQQAWAKGSIAFFFLYYVFFGIGWQGVPWVRVYSNCCDMLLTCIAVSDRNQLFGNANKGRCLGNSHELDLQFYG